MYRPRSVSTHEQAARNVASLVRLSAIALIGVYMAKRSRSILPFYADEPRRLYREDGTPRELQGTLLWSAPPSPGLRARDDLIAGVVTPIRRQRPHDALIRIDSQCFTSSMPGDTSCDCRWQKERAKDLIEVHGNGLLLLLMKGHEGRGHGLGIKIDAMAEAQQTGKSFSEVLADHELPLDVRDYTDAVKILRASPYKSARVLTNNPEKLDVVQQAGITVIREPLLPPDDVLGMPDSGVSAEYLTEWSEKQTRLGHLGMTGFDN
ncbi:MAG: hypothetical protein WDN27_03060 [Candidatus Saccharibacteria bacterium]